MTSRNHAHLIDQVVDLLGSQAIGAVGRQCPSQITNLDYPIPSGMDRYMSNAPHSAWYRTDARELDSSYKHSVLALEHFEGALYLMIRDVLGR